MDVSANDKLPADATMGPVHLRVRNLAGVVDFYQGILGMRVLHRDGDTAELGVDGAPLVRLSGDPRAPPRSRRAPGLYHVAILLPERKHLARILEHFAVFRQPLDGAADHLVSEALYLSDPEGNGIEIYADRPRETWEWRDGELVMTTAVLDIENLLEEAGDEAWNGMPEGTRVGHVHLQVSAVEDALEFYRDGIGFDLTTTYGDQAIFLSAGRYHHHLAANVWSSRGESPAPEGSSGLVAYEIRVPDAAALDAARARLARWGATREGDAVVARDPSGNVVRITAPARDGAPARP